MDTRTTKRQRFAPTIEELATKVAELTKVVEGLLNTQTETQKMTSLIREESEQNAKRFRILEACLNDMEKHRIHIENKTEGHNIQEKLPKQLALNDLPKFKGTENPLAHIRTFKWHMSIKGIKKELWPTLFPLSLEPGPQAWFYSMDPEKINTFEKIVFELSLQYRDNTYPQASARTPENLSQRDHEGFSEYFHRWREATLQQPNSLREDELVAKFISSLRLDYQVPMKYNHIETFRQLVLIGTKMEDDMRTYAGRVYNYNNSQPSGHITRRVEVSNTNTLNTLSTPAANATTKIRKRRTLTPIPMTYTETFKILNDQNKLQPIGPTEDPPVAERTSWPDSNEYCLYHRIKGHDTEQCHRLKNKIQDMIDSGELPQPPKVE